MKSLLVKGMPIAMVGSLQSYPVFYGYMDDD